MEDFTGFPKELFSFWFELQFCNTLEKLPENKIRYQQLAAEPLTRLYRALLPTVEGLGGYFDTKPARCISSMYTDRRFSPETPIKGYLYLRFKCGGGASDHPGLYFDMGPNFYSTGLRIYKQTSAGMADFRERVLGCPKVFEKELLQVAESGFSVLGERFKRERYPDCKLPHVRELLNHRTFYIGRERPINEIVFRPELQTEIALGFLKMRGLLALLRDG